MVVSTIDEVGNTEARAAVAMITVVETLFPFENFRALGMAVEASGTLVVAHSGGPVETSKGLRIIVGVEPGAVVRVNPRTGARTIISDATTGSGPALVRPILNGAIAVEASGAFVVPGSDPSTFDPSTGRRPVLVRVDPRTGAQTIISDGTMGGWPPGFFARSIAVEATGTFVVAGGFPAAVVRVDPMTGAPTIVSDATTGSGPQLRSVHGIAVEASGAFVVVSEGPSNRIPLTLVRVDPLTGARIIIANITTDRGLFGGFSTQSIAVETTGTFVVAGVFRHSQQRWGGWTR